MSQALFLAPGVAIAAIASTACTASHEECNCVPSRMHVIVPDERALDVTSVVLGGPACAGVAIACDRPGVAGGCDEYGFQADAGGDCRVDVYFASGTTFSADVTVSLTTGCCAGYYAVPPNAGEIDVPDVPAAGDAGLG